MHLVTGRLRHDAVLLPLPDSSLVPDGYSAAKAAIGET
jgi:hypothetical protein